MRQNHSRARSDQRLAATVSHFAGARWITRAQVEDLLCDLGLDGVCGVLLRLLGLPLQDRFQRPRSTTTFAIGIEHALVVDVVAMLIRLEQLGLAVDPAPFFAALRPALPKYRWRRLQAA